MSCCISYLRACPCYWDASSCLETAPGHDSAHLRYQDLCGSEAMLPFHLSCIWLSLFISTHLRSPLHSCSSPSPHSLCFVLSNTLLFSFLALSSRILREALLDLFLRNLILSLAHLVKYMCRKAAPVSVWGRGNIDIVPAHKTLGLSL